MGWFTLPLRRWLALALPLTILLQTGACLRLYEGFECELDSDCGDGERCVERGIDARCVGDNACSNDEDCPGDRICECASGNCGNYEGSCRANECGTCGRYVCLYGRCQTSCGDDTQCAEGSVCVDGGCVEDFCPSLDCGAYRCESAACLTACSDQEDCTAGYVCSDRACIPDPCPSLDCGDYICEVGACRTTCGMSSHCTGGKVCVDSECVEDPCPTLDCGTYTCRDGQCLKVCSEAADCSGDNICDVGECKTLDDAVCVGACSGNESSCANVLTKGACFEAGCDVWDDSACDGTCVGTPTSCQALHEDGGKSACEDAPNCEYLDECVGDGRVDCSTVPLSDCDNIPGCFDDGVALTCAGGVQTCSDQRFSNQCYELDGCRWGGCKDTYDQGCGRLSDGRCVRTEGCSFAAKGSAKCIGVAPDCDSVAAGECEGVPGCRAGGRCSGVPTRQCDRISILNCESYGCRDVGTYYCSGSVFCNEQSSDFACDYVGCDWAECVGTATPCGFLNQEQCDSAAACAWAP